MRRDGFPGDITLVNGEAHAPYDRPPLSKQFLAGEWDRDRLALVDPDELAQLDLDLRDGVRATGLEVEPRTVHLDDGTNISADVVVVATGSRPRTLPGTEGMSGVHLLRTLDDARALRRALDDGGRNVVVVGAGFIGAEVASTCAAEDLAVTIIEAAPVPLRRGLGDEIGRVCGELHADNGVDLRLDTTIESIRTGPNDRISSIELSDESTLDVDVLVVGIGVVPNTEWLEGSSLTIDDGVVCSEFCEAASGVFAAGDVARWHNPIFDESMRVEHWENAVDQGTYVARRILGAADDPFAPVPWFWSDQYGHKLQLAGRPAPDDRVEVVTGTVEERRFAAIYGRGDRLTGVFGLDRPRHVMQYRRLIAEGASWSDALALAEEARST